jgi:hypothetical protein
MGVGFHHTLYSQFVEGELLPNLENPRQLLSGFSQTIEPTGFGFIGPDWMPRLSHAGTYDEAWMQTRMPLLPKDFNRRFFNAAPTDQIVPQGYLRGNERGIVVGAVPEGQWVFSLPAEPPPMCTVYIKRNPMQTPIAHLDTVIVDADAKQVSLMWRAHLPVPGGRIHDVQAIKVVPHPASVHATSQPISVPVS